VPIIGTQISHKEVNMKPEKLGGWLQGLYEQSVSEREVVGTIRRDLFGNSYRMSKAGGTALAVGKNTTSPATNADWEDCVAAAAVAVGGKSVTITITDAAADVLAENYFRGGQLQVNDADGEGTWYRISHSTAVTNGGTTITFALEDGIRVALTTSSKLTPVPNAYMATILSATATLPPTGVPLIAVTASYYYWSQTGGEGVYWTNADLAAVGSPLVLSADDGELGPIVATTGADVLQSNVAIAIGTATHVDTDYNSCKYVID